jgi:hypothetical protein
MRKKAARGQRREEEDGCAQQLPFISLLNQISHPMKT